jgi:muramidase (phage lysozyme)
MAEVLQEFLVSLKYAVDQSSQQRFLDVLKRVAGSVSGVAAELTGLTAAIIEMGRAMAESGERFYYMSQRLGSSVAGIQQATFAFAQFGASAGQVEQALESLGSFTRSYGPGATNLLRTWGITARDTAGQFAQLGQHLRAIGFMPGREGTTGYAVGLRELSMLGISETAGRAAAADPEQVRRQQEAATRIQRGVFGSDFQQKIQQFSAQSVQFMNLIREFGFMFRDLWQYLATQLLPRLIPLLQQMFDTMLKNLPTIKVYLKDFSDVLIAVVQGVTELVTVAGQLPPALIAMVTAITTSGIAIKLATSPVFLMLSALTALMLLLDDYKGYHEGKRSLIDWSKWDQTIDDFSKTLKPVTDALGGWQNTLEDIAAGVLIAKVVKQIALITGAMNDLSGATKAASLGLGLTSLGIAAFAVLAGVTRENKDLQDQIKTEAAKMGFEQRSHGFFAMPDFYNAKTGTTMSYADMMKTLGAGPEGFNPIKGILPHAPGTAPASLPPTTGKKTSFAPMSPVGSVLLANIASGESGGSDPYHELYGGGSFSGNQFPSWAGVNVGGSMTHAAGKYQFEPATWREAQQALNLPDFSPASQDAAAWWLAQRDYNARTGRDLSADLKDPTKAGYIAANLHSTWTSAGPGRWSRMLALQEGAVLPGGVQTAKGGPGGGNGTAVTLNQTTTVQVAPGPTAGATAAAVAGAQGRVNQDAVKNMQGALR